MPYTEAHGRLSILGDSFAGIETWQTGLRLRGTAVPTAAQLSSVNTAVQTFLSTTALAFPTGFTYRGLKWSPQDVNGQYGATGAPVYWWRPTGHSGSSAGYPQIACVTSLRTARPRGLGSNGRMYWPSGTLVDFSSGKMTVANADAINAAFKTLLVAIGASGVGTPAVFSLGGKNGAPPVTETVTGCRVGRVMDTQRRRRNKIVESYSATISVP